MIYNNMYLLSASPFSNGRRDRHAKTLDIAQEEVLTCLGIHTYDRLHKIWQKLKAEEQTWQILFFLGVDALKQSFEVTFFKIFHQHKSSWLH